MKIREVNENKKQFIALLLLADEQENMIDHYLEKGTMYVLEDGLSLIHSYSDTCSLRLQCRLWRRTWSSGNSIIITQP